MIGNDIVDLNLAKTESNWKRNGFLEKIFTEKEQEFINYAKSSFEMVWLLWSMKESAYKIFFKQHSLQFFAPKRFECDINTSRNTVKIDDMVYDTTSTISNNSIHTIANLTTAKSIITDCFKLENNRYEVQHYTTYNNLKKEAAKQFNIPISHIDIKKNQFGIPIIDQLPKIQISISHHGFYGAYAFVV